MCICTDFNLFKYSCMYVCMCVFKPLRTLWAYNFLRFICLCNVNACICMYECMFVCGGPLYIAMPIGGSICCHRCRVSGESCWNYSMLRKIAWSEVGKSWMSCRNCRTIYVRMYVCVCRGTCIFIHTFSLKIGTLRRSHFLSVCMYMYVCMCHLCSC